MQNKTSVSGRPSSKCELISSDGIHKCQAVDGAVDGAFESASSDERRVEKTAMILRRHTRSSIAVLTLTRNGSSFE